MVTIPSSEQWVDALSAATADITRTDSSQQPRLREHRPTSGRGVATTATKVLGEISARYSDVRHLEAIYGMLSLCMSMMYAMYYIHSSGMRHHTGECDLPYLLRI
jgi:hypothetical protein